jgi:biotin transport system substrate-specific component
MQKSDREAVLERSNIFESGWVRQLFLVIAGSIFVAICARISVPLPHTPVPLTLSNFAVLLVGLLLGGRLGFAALLLYLLEGAAGLPVFSNGSLGIFGPTGGYLLAYPSVALLTGFLRGRGALTFFRALLASIAGEVLLFAIALSWLVTVFHAAPATAIRWGLYPFFVCEAAKIFAAAGLGSRSRFQIPSK